MPHKRDEIRKLIVDTLKNKTLAKDNVFNWRIRPIQNEHSLPCISVLIPEENVLEISGAHDLICRNAEVYLVIYNTVSNNDDNMSDVIARQVESLMNTIDKNGFTFKYKKMEVTTENHSAKILILCSLVYECVYKTKEESELNLDIFNQLSVEVCHG